MKKTLQRMVIAWGIGFIISPLFILSKITPLNLGTACGVVFLGAIIFLYGMDMKTDE